MNTALPYLADLADAFDQAQPRPQVSDYSAISSIMQVYFHKALTGEQDYESALAELNEELNTAYEKQK